MADKKEKSVGVWFKSNRHILLFLCYIPVRILYFLTQYICKGHTVIHVRLDDFIPFLPVFVIPYVVWYVYVPILMLWACFKDKKVFKSQCVRLFSGIYIGIAVFILFPTSIDFRPIISGSDIFSRMCAWIYSNDKPVNVLPSLHCFEACCIHIATFCGTPFGKKRIARVLSAVIMTLICLSTVFVKQHSIVDLILGCLMAVFINAVADKVKIK